MKYNYFVSTLALSTKYYTQAEQAILSIFSSFLGFQFSWILLLITCPWSLVSFTSQLNWYFKLCFPEVITAKVKKWTTFFFLGLKPLLKLFCRQSKKSLEDWSFKFSISFLKLPHERKCPKNLISPSTLCTGNAHRLFKTSSYKVHGSQQ